MKRIAAAMGLSLVLMATGMFPAAEVQRGQAVADDSADDDEGDADDGQNGAAVGTLPALTGHWQ